MDVELYEAAHAAVQAAHRLHNSLSSMITRELFDANEKQEPLVKERVVVPPLGA